MYTYKIEVDWLGTGSWTDITADVRWEEKVRYSRGRDSELGYCVAGAMDFYVNNPTGAYTPGNATFPTNATDPPNHDLKLRMPIRLSGYAGIVIEWVYLWTGYITQITPKPRSDQRKAYIECQDALSLFNRCSVSSVSIRYGESTGVLLDWLLADYAWGGSAALDAGETACTMAWWHNEKLLEMAKLLLESEDGGYASMFFSDHAGIIVFHDAGHRALLSVLHVFDDKEIADISYKVSDRNQYEQILLTGHKRGWPNVLSVIWGSGVKQPAELGDCGLIEVPGGSAITVVAELGGPGMLDDDPEPGGPFSAGDWRSSDENFYDHGAHTGGNNHPHLHDDTKNWAVDSLVGRQIRNLTDGSAAEITANTATTVTATLSGGSGNDWDTGDAYYISGGDCGAFVVITCPTADRTSESVSIKITNSQTYTVWIIPGTTDPDRAITLHGKMASDSAFTVESKTAAPTAGLLKIDQRFQADKNTMQTMADSLLADLRDVALDQVRVTIKNGTNALHTQILTRELGEAIGISSLKLGIAEPFFIEQMSHEFDQFDHEVEYLVSQHPKIGALYWILGTSALGVDTRLAHSVTKARTVGVDALIGLPWILGTSALGTDTILA